jgi:predicted O-methyltransferase YrrM
VSIKQGAEMLRAIKANGCKRTLEIGFAYGFSTVWMMAANFADADASQVAIDPFEKSQWGGVGLAQVERLAPAAAFRWIESRSAPALIELLHAEESFDFVFIDGNHRFDDVLVDFTLADQLLPPGGLIALDDLWMPSVRTAASFIVSNSGYVPVEQPVANLGLFRKERWDDRDWDHFVPFRVHREDWRQPSLRHRVIGRVKAAIGR